MVANSLIPSSEVVHSNAPVDVFEHCICQILSATTAGLMQCIRHVAGMDFFQVKYEAHKDVVIALVGFPSGARSSFLLICLDETITLSPVDQIIVFIKVSSFGNYCLVRYIVACGWPLLNLKILVA